MTQQHPMFPSPQRAARGAVVRSAVGAGLAALVVTGAVTVLRQRNRIAELLRQLDNHEAELEHLRTKRLPALAESLNGGTHVRVPGPLGGGDENGAAESLEALVGGIEEVVRLTREHVEQASRRTLTGVLDTVRGLAAEQHMAVSEMQHRHDDADVLADLYTIDHAGSQLSRRLRGFAVLFGAWIGQQRSATLLQEVLRGAQSQIRDYQRVTVSPHCPRSLGCGPEELGVVTRAVEPLVLVVAELLDNATRYSPPYAQVWVGVQPAHNGVAVTVEDAGVGMPLEEQRRAARLLSNERVPLDEIGDPPRVGFAVIGLLAARYGLRVSVDSPSSYGGVRAVVFVPNELLTRLDSEESEPEETRQPASTVTASGAGSNGTETTSSGLPKRGGRKRNAAARPAPAAAPDSSGSAVGLAAWQQATEANSPGRGNDDGEDGEA